MDYDNLDKKTPLLPFSLDYDSTGSRHAMFRRFQLILLIPAAIILALKPLSEGQAQNVPYLFANPQGEESVSEEETRTINRAIEDLKSGDLETRVGAAMLLGKYNNPEVMQALITALQDDEVRIRRAALISILEKRTPMFSPALTEVMLPMLADPDAEIRRQISSILPRLTASWSMGFQASLPSRSRQPYPENFDQIFINAFSDTEVVVRRNMMEHPGIVPLGMRLTPVLLHRLTDKDLQVRLLALREVGRRAESEEFLKLAASNALGENPLWDRELARQLAYHPHRQSLELLQQMSQSQDRLTRTEADISHMLITYGDWESAPGFERLMQDSIPPETAQRAVRGLYNLERSETARLAARLMTAESEAVRIEALNLWLTIQADLPPQEALELLLGDSSRNIRRRTFQLLRSRPHLIPESLIRKMAVHPQIDVREHLLGLFDALPEELAGDVIFDLLIDSHLPIRQQALRQAVRLETPGWSRILQASLRDPNSRIQITAAELIVRTEEKDGLKALREHIEAQPDSELARHFRARTNP